MRHPEIEKLAPSALAGKMPMPSEKVGKTLNQDWRWLAKCKVALSISRLEPNRARNLVRKCLRAELDSR